MRVAPRRSVAPSAFAVEASVLLPGGRALVYCAAMPSQATTVQQYLAELPADRRAAIEAVRAVIVKNLDKKGLEEGMQYGMIGYFVPHRLFPAGYHCDPRQPLPYASLASQKNHMAIYLMSAYLDADLDMWLREAWAKAGKKLDMGKSCIRFKRVDDLALDVLGEAIRRVPAKAFIDRYESILAASGKPAKAAAKTTAAKTAAKPTAKTLAKTTAKPATKTTAKPAAKPSAAKPVATKTTPAAAMKKKSTPAPAKKAASKAVKH